MGATTATQATQARYGYESLEICWQCWHMFMGHNSNQHTYLFPLVFTDKVLCKIIRRHNFRDAIVKSDIRTNNPLVEPGDRHLVGPLDMP